MIELLQRNGYTVKKESSNFYDIAGTGGWKVALNTNKIVDVNKKGWSMDTVAFIQEEKGYSYQDSMKYLLDLAGEKIETVQIKESTYKEKKAKEFVLPKYHKDVRAVYRYLLNDRCIDKEILSKAMNDKKIKQDDRYNCVFLGYDETGKVAYGSRRGSSLSSNFRGELTGSNKEHAFGLFSKNSDTLICCESAIDVLSCASLSKMRGNNYQDYNIISLGGTSDVAIDGFLKKNKKIRRIILAMDNDKAGQENAEKHKQKYEKQGFKVTIRVPQTKDFNEYLQLKSKTKSNVKKKLQKKERGSELEM